MNPVEPFNLDLRALATFLVVLDEGSVSRAAVTLGVSQSAVSHTLERLRQALGDPLFVKSGRGITPTRYAQQAGPHIRQVLGSAEQPGLDQALSARNLRRTKRVSVSNFSALASLLYGTDMLACGAGTYGSAAVIAGRLGATAVRLQALYPVDDLASALSERCCPSLVAQPDKRSGGHHEWNGAIINRYHS